jgi:uncharacterized protein (TIGR00369 family)
VADAEQLAFLENLNRQFEGFVPHNRALGIEIVALASGEATMKLPWAEHLVGNPDTGTLHGGVISSLLDACSGAAVFMKLPEPMGIATLDLRVDYFKPATPRVPVQARCFCTKVTRNVAFVRGVAFHDDESDPVAAVTGTFMLGTSTRRTEGA